MVADLMVREWAYVTKFVRVRTSSDGNGKPAKA